MATARIVLHAARADAAWRWRSMLLFPVLLTLGALAASAAMPGEAQGAPLSGNITFVHRDYTAQITSAGDVLMTERWQVQFTGGPFHHAFLQVYLARTAGIDFGKVSEATPGSQQVTEATDAAGNPVRQVAWNFPSTQDGSRTFEILYTIHGGLGISTTQAWLDWHFLDGGSQTSFPVTSSQVTIILPAPTPASELQVKTTDADGALTTTSVNDTTTMVAGHQLSSNDPLEVEVVFPRAELDANVKLQPWQSSYTPPDPPTALGLANGTSPGGKPDSGLPATASYPSSQPNAYAGLGGLCLLVVGGVIFAGAIALSKLSGTTTHRPQMAGGPGGPWWYGGGLWRGGGGGLGGGGGFGGGGGAGGGSGGGGGGGGASGFS
jgi:Predicted membrane protein (DUF2207)